jgi:hypothetical protein
MMVGRNHACPCGSGKKYKKCCERAISVSVAERESEDRGEIPVPLEDDHPQEEELQDFPVRESESESIHITSFWPTIETRAEEQILSQRIMHQLEQFFLEHVAPLQKRTQAFYSESLELLHQYLSIYYGKKFDWLMINEDVLLHFLGVWYVDHGKISANRCKIFLNTLKHLFRWLQVKEISDVYQIFKKGYPLLLHALPMTVEVRKWLLQHATPLERRQGKKITSSEMYMLAILSTGPVVRVEERWISIPLPDFRFTWTDHRFWVKGSIEMGKFDCYFTQIEGVYPLILLDEPLQALGNK